MKRMHLIDLMSLFFFLGMGLVVSGFVLIACGFLNISWFPIIFYSGLGIIGFGSLLTPMAIWLYSFYIFRKTKIYGLYNPISKAIEYHIGSKMKTQMQFAKSMSTMKNHAVRLNKDIVFCTNLLSFDKVSEMEKRFGVKIEIYSVNFAEKISFYIPYFITMVWRKEFKRHTLIKGVVRFRQ